MISLKLGLVASLRVASSISLLKRCFTGSRKASTSNAADEVLLKAPVIILAALLCTAWNLFRIVESVPLLSCEGYLQLSGRLGAKSKSGEESSGAVD